MERIRAAQPDEIDAINALIVRSKAHWGYSDEFMRAFAADLHVPPDALDRHEVYVLERDGELLGMCQLQRTDDPKMFYLEDLFIDPTAIGRGYGKRLWAFITERAQALGGAALTLTADPNAEGFYVSMGAERYAVKESSIPGRLLPMMRYNLRNTAQSTS